MNVILVMFGGFLGAISRFLLGNWSFLHSTYGFPTGTLIINLVGSLLLGWLVANYRDQYPRIFLFLVQDLSAPLQRFQHSLLKR